MFLDQIYQDYLTRLVQARETMLSALLTRMAAAGSDDDAMSELESACLRTVGLTLDAVRRTSPDRLVELLHLHRSDFRAVLLAELLLKDVELSEQMGQFPQAMVSRLQAFCLLVDSVAWLGPEAKAEYRPKLDALATELEAMGEEPYVREKIDGYRAEEKFRTEDGRGD